MHVIPGSFFISVNSIFAKSAYYRFDLTGVLEGDNYESKEMDNQKCN